MTKLLPSTPNLHHLCTQAKDLLTLCRLSDPSAIKLIKAHCHALANAGSVRVAERIKLSDAQHAIARSYGFTCWASLSATANKRQNDVQSLSKALTDPRMENLSYRLELARKKGLPEIGTSHVSEHGVRYDVVDYMIAMAPCRPERSSSGGLPVHIDDLLPIISFPEMSDRLRELYVETDCVTTKPLVFFDTLPAAHPATAAPGLNQALTINAEAPIHVLFDAASVHETIIAHELGHIWVEKVEQREDYRHLRDQSDPRRVTQFSHIQSFVMDLCVNDMLMRRGFDVSIIARHEAEGILHFAANCARGEQPKNKRVLAGVISALAGAMLEMERLPDDWAPDVKDALEVLRLRLPEAFEPAMGFVRSVLCHGYHDSAAIMQAVDDCAAISFAATGEDFDPARDLIEVPNVEPNWDKRPSFLACLPIESKLDVCRETAKRGITGTAKYDVVVSRDTRASVTVTDPQGCGSEPLRLSFSVAPPPGRRFMQADPALRPNAGAPHSVSVLAARAAGPMNSARRHMPLPLPGSLPGEQNRIGHPAGARLSNMATAGQPGFVPAHVLQARRINEQLEKQRLDERYRQWMQTIEATRQHCESYDGSELKPFLTPAGEEHARLHPRPVIAPAAASRNYMAGLGRWISQVGFAQQAGGEPAYGYANNNPVTYFDPDGTAPRSSPKPISLIGKQYTNCKAHTQACVNYIFQKHGPTVDPCYQGAGMKSWQNDLMSCACVTGNNGADPLLLLAVAACETRWGTNPPNDPIRCHNQFGWWFNRNARHPTLPGAPSIGKLRLCHPGPNRNTLGPIPTYKEAACATAGKILSDGGILYDHIKSGNCISKMLPKWSKECKDAGL